MSISVEQFGKDHWSLLAYVETRCVDYKGELDREHLRCNEKIRPMLKGYRTAGPGMGWKPEYGTRLKGYFEDRTNKALKLEDHDDWDCLDDLEDAGYIEILSLVNGWVTLTKLGSEVSSKLRLHKAQGKMFADFTLAA